MDNLVQDLRYGFRTLQRRPGFTAMAVLTLALAIGTSTAIFSVVNAVLIRPLPYREPDRLMFISAKDLKKQTPTVVSLPTFEELRKQSETFDQIACYAPRGFFIDGPAGPELVFGMRVSSDFFNVLGVAPVLGRTLAEGEDQPGVSPVAVLSHQLWLRRYGSDPEIVGKTITAGQESYTVVGVMPRKFTFRPEVRLKPEMWVSLAPSAIELTMRTSQWRMIARLNPTATKVAAVTEMDAIAERLAEQYPDYFSNTGIRVVPVREEIVGGVSKTLLTLLGAVGFVLLIACANVASLLLAHGLARQKEIALRAIMGATRLRLIRQMMTESLALSLAGGAIALVLVMWALDGIVWLSPKDLPRVEETGLDWRVFAFALILSAASSLIFGLVPALYASKPNLFTSLKYGSSAYGATRGWLRSALVVTEVALAVILLVGAGLMINSFVRINNVDKGFDPENLLTVQLTSLSEMKGPDQVALVEAILQRVERLPGVEAAGVVDFPALSQGWMRRSFRKSQFVEGEGVDSPNEEIVVEPHAATHGYFHTMGIKILSGSGYKEANLPQALVSESLARAVWGDQDPIGKRIRDGERGVTVVGVVSDVRQHGPLQEPVLMLYRPFNQRAQGAIGLIVRTRANPLNLAASVRAEILNADSRTVIIDVQSMAQRLSDTVAQPRFYTVLLGWFAAMGALLASLGLYGVISYSTSQRTHEIGVRMALGAQGKDILSLVVGKGVFLTLIGVGVGLLSSLALTRLLTSLLFGVSPADPLTYAAVSALLSSVALLASYIPARRATRIDPMVALRYE